MPWFSNCEKNTIGDTQGILVQAIKLYKKLNNNKYWNVMQN